MCSAGRLRPDDADRGDLPLIALVTLLAGVVLAHALLGLTVVLGTAARGVTAARGARPYPSWFEDVRFRTPGMPEAAEVTPVSSRSIAAPEVR